MRARMAAAGCCASRIWIGRARFRAPRRASCAPSRHSASNGMASVVRQAERTSALRRCARGLRARGLTFECSCSRLQARRGGRAIPEPAAAARRSPDAATATRLRVDPGYVQFRDRIQGSYRQDVAAAVGDVILKRRDQHVRVSAGGGGRRCRAGRHARRARRRSAGQHAPPNLSAAAAGSAAHPIYAHLPVLIEADGSKLAKSRAQRAPGRARGAAAAVVCLRPAGPGAARLALATETIGAAWTWAIAQWDIESGRQASYTARWRG